VRTGNIPIKRGTFQGDSLTPLWFCLALNPLSAALSRSSYGYEVRGSRLKGYKINHLLYMDDKKVYAATKVQPEGLLKLVKTFSGDISIRFGLDKCCTQSVIRGRQTVGEVLYGWRMAVWLSRCIMVKPKSTSVSNRA